MIVESFIAGLAVIGVLGITALVFLAFSIPLYILYGWVLTKLWGWFIVPFFGAAPLPMAIAIGLALIAGMLITTMAAPKEHLSEGEKKEYNRKKIVAAIIKPLAILLIGWIVSHWVPPAKVFPVNPVNMQTVEATK